MNALPGWLLAGLLMAAPAFGDSLRCGSQLVSEGDSLLQVQRQCGEPAQRQQLAPARLADGRIAPGAASVELWEYGPDHGAYHSLRFVDGRLVEIRMSRD